MSPPKSGNAPGPRGGEPSSKKFKHASASFLDTKSLVTFIVGPDGNTTEFIVHKEIVCHHSKVLNAAFNSEFVEGLTQTYRLNDFGEGTFKFAIQWMYSQKLNLLHKDANHASDETTMLEDRKQISDLTELWVLADRIAMPNLQNAAIDALHSMCLAHKFLQSEDLLIDKYQYIYQNTSYGSQLRKYILAPFIYRVVEPGFIENHAEDCPKEMLVDISEMHLSGYFAMTRDIKARKFYVDIDA
ncbi:hypothetical protein VTL71DRAFT_12071 [Oculimacula yallundae]|uniref:BTB domain-containing protein n=1 Tax=Oculimacula yallundae TaxID=86028 RepID=A0ABR4CTP0_9HELO